MRFVKYAPHSNFFPIIHTCIYIVFGSRYSYFEEAYNKNDELELSVPLPQVTQILIQLKNSFYDNNGIKLLQIFVFKYLKLIFVKI